MASEAEALLARREARRFSMRENEAGPELRFGDLDGIVFEDGLDECIGANLVLWLNRMLASAKEAARPAPAGEAAEVERLRGQVADFAEALTRTNRAVLAISGQRDDAEAALAQARAENERLWAELELARGVGR